MNFRQNILDTFHKKNTGPIVWQPRIYYWYNWNVANHSLPSQYQNKTMLEIYDAMNISPRYFPEVLQIHAVKEIPNSSIRIIDKTENNTMTVIYQTPAGELTQELKKASHEGWRTTRFPVQSADDIRKCISLYENTDIHFDEKVFDTADRIFQNRGEPQFYLPHSGYQELILRWMGLTHLIYALKDIPHKVEQLIDTIERSYNRLYDQIIRSGKIKIINFGENIDVQLCPPEYFEKYCIPFYEKRVHQMKSAGIFTHIHIDGKFKPLLKYLKHLPFDGYESLTPIPQGDITPEQIKESIGGKILLDGIPAIYFLPEYSEQELIDMTLKLLNLFSPNLILGASDEIPPMSDIHRIQLVSEIIHDYSKSKSLRPV